MSSYTSTVPGCVTQEDLEGLPGFNAVIWPETRVEFWDALSGILEEFFPSRVAECSVDDDDDDIDFLLHHIMELRTRQVTRIGPETFKYIDETGTEQVGTVVSKEEAERARRTGRQSNDQNHDPSDIQENDDAESDRATDLHSVSSGNLSSSSNDSPSQTGESESNNPGRRQSTVSEETNVQHQEEHGASFREWFQSAVLRNINIFSTSGAGPSESPVVDIPNESFEAPPEHKGFEKWFFP